MLPGGGGGDLWRKAVRPTPVGVIMSVASLMLTTLGLPVFLWYCITDFTGTSMGSFAVLPFMCPSLVLMGMTWTHVLPWRSAGSIPSNAMGMIVSVVSALCVLLQPVFLWNGMVDGATAAPLDNVLINQQEQDSMAIYIIFAVGVFGAFFGSAFAGFAFTVQLLSLVITGSFGSVPLLGNLATKFMRYVP